MTSAYICCFFFSAAASAATTRWQGQADAVAQESRATPANVEVGDVFALKAGGTTIATYTAAAATVADVTAGLATAWNASTHPWATGVTASDQTTYVKLLADTAGIPFTVTSTATDGGGANTQTLTITTPTASAGPNDWSTAANWSGGAVPVNSDTVIIENGSVPILWGLNQSSVTLAELRIMQSYEGLIGLPETSFATSVSGVTVTADSTKPEYRDTYLRVGATALNIGQHTGGATTPAGATRIKINVGSVQTAATIYNTCSTSADSSLQPVRLLGTHGSNSFTIYSGTAGIATENGSETSDSVTVYVFGGSLTLGRGCGYANVLTTGGTVYVHSAATAGVIQVSNGNVFIDSPGDSITKMTALKGGTITTSGGFTATDAEAFGGRIVAKAGDITTVTVDVGGEVDFSQSPVAVQVDFVLMKSGGGTVITHPLLTLPDNIEIDSAGTEVPMRVVATPK